MDPRRDVPRTDTLLADPRLAQASARLGQARVRSAVTAAQQQVREGAIAPDAAISAALAGLPTRPASLRPVINATGVLLHTNLGRAPLSDAAREAVASAAGYTDVEFDLATSRRARRGRHTLGVLKEAVPGAEAVHVVNNNAAALLLVSVVLAGSGQEIVLSRGEMVEIGDGFRLPDLLESAGARLREVGTTNRTTRSDYAAAVGPQTGFLLKVHPSNFRIEGFTAAASVREITSLGVPVVVDVGSGLLAPEPQLPGEPDVRSALAAGADLVTASGDKLLGGPQAGLLFGRQAVVDRLRRHPLSRALRVDKLTLAALEATIAGPPTPIARVLAVGPHELTERARRLARQLADDGVDALAVDSQAVVGGGGAPGVTLPSAAISLPEAYALPLRSGDPAVVGRLDGGRLVLDLCAVPPRDDALIRQAVRTAERARCMS
jgi:L-seryl-tRNA(Ser) seleniumtransferase